MEQLSPQLMNRLVFAVIMHGLNDAQTNLALSVLTDALSHESAQIRELAVVALADLAVPAVRRVAPLATALTDKNPRVRRRAARALGDQGQASQSALLQLMVGLGDTDPSVRRDCAGAIGRLGASGHPAASALVPLLSETEHRSRAVTAVALRRIGKAAVPALLDGVRSADPELRGRCATLAAKIAPGDELVEHVLETALTDEDAEVRARADEALQLVRTPPPVPLAV
jgi:HEAT repeat protein